MHTRERLTAVEPRDHGLFATTLKMRDEVFNIASAPESIEQVKPNKQMIDIAQKIIEQKKGEFDADEFTDCYEEALRALIDERQHGHKLKRVDVPTDTGNVIDRMDALRKSLGKKAQSAKAIATPKKSASARKPIKKAAR